MGFCPSSTTIVRRVMEACCLKGNENSNYIGSGSKKIRGEVVLMKKNVLNFNDLMASLMDRIHELLGKGVSMQLISSTHPEPSENGLRLRGKVGKVAYLENWVTTITSLTQAEETTFTVSLDWDDSHGTPEALLIRNHHHSQFYLKTVTLEGVPGHGQLHFVCNSWVYPARRYKYNRIFFPNKAYLPSQTPELLLPYREEELRNLRGSGSGKLKEWDRVYDYDYYNDLGTPDKGPEYARPILGGSEDYPYPRRGKTGRKATKTDPNSESRLPLLSLDIYVPKDERFGHAKFSEFLAYGLKSLNQILLLELKSCCDKTINEFDTLKDVFKLYDGGTMLPNGPTLKKVKKRNPWKLLRERIRSGGERFLKFPLPDVIEKDRSAWRTDEEFGREMLAGVNPVNIACLQEFPPASKLDPELYGNQNSSIKEEHIQKNLGLEGLTIEEAKAKKKLFILDHHDAVMPYLRKINSTNSKIYATRTLLLLKKDGTLKPLAIELSLPHPQGDHHGAVSKVFTPPEKDIEGIENSVWQLAKAYAAVNDSGYHQLISHWLNTHAVIEPFIIATNRQLSVLHPIHKLLHPHFRDTMHINALARHILINSHGLLERTVFPGRFSMEMSAVVYKNWKFTEQALPADLLKRGMAVEDSESPHAHGLKLLIEDYPFAVDGLEIWSAIETWVEEYCSFYYPTDEEVQRDPELQNWWTEIRNVGHGDKKDEKWWPEMQKRGDVIQSCTIIIWVASALHAAVNFGQYSYAGFLPNRPTISRRFMPEPGTPEYAELDSNLDTAFLKTITAQLQTLLGVSLIELLSRHSTDEVYLGQRDTPLWTSDAEPLAAFARFREKLEKIENGIKEMNDHKTKWKNRNGPIDIPYMLLYPNTSNTYREGGLTGKGIPG